MLLAVHSNQGDITKKLLKNDETYAELAPRENIKILYILPNNSQEQTTRTFILYKRTLLHNNQNRMKKDNLDIS